MRRVLFLVAAILFLADGAFAQIPVPSAPVPGAAQKTFKDRHYGVEFVVPPGWSLAKKDGQVSTFRLDARSATSKAEMRAVSSMEFNPFPLSTLGGAFFYYSVQRHTNDAECAQQATGVGRADATPIGGMDFNHGHDEHGDMCVESRDEVFTAFRKGSCFRFDLTVNTFCSVSSGAQEMSKRQMRDIEGRMERILDSVVFAGVKKGTKPPVGPGRRPLTAAMGVGDSRS